MGHTGQKSTKVTGFQISVIFLTLYYYLPCHFLRMGAPKKPECLYLKMDFYMLTVNGEPLLVDLNSREL